jgi:hypothetical protein
MGGKLEKGRLALLKSEEVAGLVVGSAVCPAAVEDANPLEGERAESRLFAREKTSILAAVSPGSRVTHSFGGPKWNGFLQ